MVVQEKARGAPGSEEVVGTGVTDELKVDDLNDPARGRRLWRASHVGLPF